VRTEGRRCHAQQEHGSSTSRAFHFKLGKVLWPLQLPSWETSNVLLVLSLGNVEFAQQCLQ
jgi:hypothetical protein